MSGFFRSRKSKTQDTKTVDLKSVDVVVSPGGNIAPSRNGFSNPLGQPVEPNQSPADLAQTVSMIVPETTVEGLQNEPNFDEPDIKGRPPLGEEFAPDAPKTLTSFSSVSQRMIENETESGSDRFDLGFSVTPSAASFSSGSDDSSVADPELSTHAERILKADPFYRIARAKRAKTESTAPNNNRGFAYGIHRILRPHVKGGMGQVHIAYDQFLKREVALKELFPDSTHDESIVHRFIVEAEITAQLEHPGIVPIHSLGLDTNGNPYYTMKLIRGKTFQEAVKQYFRSPNPVELKRLVRRFVSVCQTMSFAHRKGVIHRDLKPANIMLSDDGETLIMDWGIAKQYSSAASGITVSATTSKEPQPRVGVRPDLTVVGTVVGTPAYMSPEQASPDSPDVGPVSDVFSLGAILFFLLTGRNAYTGRNSQEILTRVLTSKPPKPSDVARNIPKELEAICLKAMSRKIVDRYQSADALSADICNWLDGEPITAMRMGLLERFKRFLRKHHQMTLILVSTFFVMLAISTFFLMLLDRNNQRIHWSDSQQAVITERIRSLDQEIQKQEKTAKETRVKADQLFQEASTSTLDPIRTGLERSAKEELARAVSLDATLSELKTVRKELQALSESLSN
ncbi:MAG: serine/threonine protein kinase [Thermoguttaceae bacterium]